MMQVFAILNDSYRELRSRSLFWITLSISVLVSVALFGLIGFDERGWHVLWFSTNESPVLREGTPAARDLLSWLFGGVLLWWWLTWGAILIGLIATSSTIPEFVTSGSIDLVLAKPIGRLKLYAVKVLGAMLFVLLQVVISVLIAYLLLGIRFDMWFHDAWLAVPLVTLQFFYLFAVMSLVGLVTRSTLASLLAVLLFWGAISLVQFASNQLHRTVTEAQSIIAQADERIANIRSTAEAETRDLTPAEHRQIASAENHTAPMRSIVTSIAPWRRPIDIIELLVPKTGDIQKVIAEQVKAPTFPELMMTIQGYDPETMAQMAGMSSAEEFQRMQRAGVAGSRAVRAVDTLSSIGSSLVFTAVVFLLSLWIFARRDF